MVAFCIAKYKKPYNIGECLVKPSLFNFTSKFLRPSAAKLIYLPLSNDTISRRINYLSVHIEEQVIDKIKLSEWFTIQLDESTDIYPKKAILLCYVRFIDFHTLCEDLLCWCGLPTRTTGQHLVVKKNSPDLNEGLIEVVKIINFIKSIALNSSLFSILCEEMGSEHSHLLMHAEVRLGILYSVQCIVVNVVNDQAPWKCMNPFQISLEGGSIADLSGLSTHMPPEFSPMLLFDH
ncbi:zinc finger MYM-type protein 6-like [Metopolophium dirhodum]|uniref:zinc finger MYM-type protein 6-like n=1 Tax=Metopolophium dirhodum TaxID=44670 RepID=UPI00298F8368|nr:zinc finger MYM-type protein 6-like [Metopolophium dirhodum]